MIRKPLIEVIEVGKRGEIVLPRNLGAYLDVLGTGADLTDE